MTGSAGTPKNSGETFDVRYYRDSSPEAALRHLADDLEQHDGLVLIGLWSIEGNSYGWGMLQAVLSDVGEST